MYNPGQPSHDTVLGYVRQAVAKSSQARIGPVHGVEVVRSGFEAQRGVMDWVGNTKRTSVSKDYKQNESFYLMPK